MSPTPRPRSAAAPAPDLDAAQAVARQFAAAGVPAQAAVDGAGTPILEVEPARWLAAAEHARGALEMDFLDWLSAVDQPDSDPVGVDVVLHVVASGTAGESSTGESSAGARGGPRRLLLRTRVPQAAFTLASLTGVWPGVAWHERETFEMFGVVFAGFDDGTDLGLRPLLLPDGFEGTPLRKSFVLAARASKPWPGAKEPGESEARGASPGRRRLLPPGVPDPSWGPRAAGEGDAAQETEAPEPARRNPRREPRGSRRERPGEGGGDDG